MRVKHAASASTEGAPEVSPRRACLMDCDHYVETVVTTRAIFCRTLLLPGSTRDLALLCVLCHQDCALEQSAMSLALICKMIFIGYPISDMKTL